MPPTRFSLSTFPRPSARLATCGPSGNPQGVNAITVAGGGVKTITLTTAIQQTAKTFNVSGDALVFAPQTAPGVPPLITITGTFPGGASHGFQNWAFTLGGSSTSTDGANNLGNNGTFICYDSTGTTMSFVNPLGVSETLPTGAQLSSSASTTAYIGTFQNAGSGLYYGGFNGWTGQPNIVVAGFDIAGNNGSFTAIANSNTVLAVTNAGGANDTHSATMVLAPALGNSVIGHNDVSLLYGANPNTSGILVGLSDSAHGTIQNLLIEANTITSTNTSSSGIYVAPGATASGWPASSGLDIKGNVITGTYYGIRGDAVTTATPFNDITIEGNKILSSAYEQIVFPTPPAVYRVWDNVLSATQTTQSLNGGATVDTSGNITSPGWILPGSVQITESSNTITWNPAYGTNYVTLNGNATTVSIAAGQPYQQMCFDIVQGSSVYSITWPVNMDGFSQPSPLPYYRTLQCAIYDNSVSRWYATGPASDSVGNLSAPGVFSAAGGIFGKGGTFICTAAGTISISNTSVDSTSDITISMAPGGAGGTITTPPAFKTVTAGTGFTVLCGASDTSTYRYRIWN